MIDKKARYEDPRLIDFKLQARDFKKLYPQFSLTKSYEIRARSLGYKTYSGMLKEWGIL